ncbi:MAG: hypothetical protein ACI4QV_00795 [Acutalibacteraceae bacterium]
MGEILHLRMSDSYCRYIAHTDQNIDFEQIFRVTRQPWKNMQKDLPLSVSANTLQKNLID